MDPPILKLTVTITLAVILTAALPSPSTSSPALPPYTNHTVGGSTGWFFDPKSNASATDYSLWARSQSFHLGDFLVFRTNSNMSVVQTYNETTYRICDTSEDGGDDTFVYTNGGEEGFGVAAVVAVPLTAATENYFFSDDGDGIQCLNGMRFKISVEKGRGLPPELIRPPPPPYMDPVAAPPPPAVEDGGSSQTEAYHNGEGGGGGKGIWGVVFGGVLGFVGLVV